MSFYCYVISGITKLICTDHVTMEQNQGELLRCKIHWPITIWMKLWHLSDWQNIHFLVRRVC